MKKLTTGKIWQFAAGQFGWAMLSGIISNWLVYFYQPDKTAISQGQTVFIPQGLVVFGIFTIIGGITAFGRIFDAFTDPMIASLSDRCTSKNGRRIPFLKWASLPLALSTVLVFWSPVNKNSWINGVFLLIMILAYYLSITAYCTPYNALIPELGHTQQERLNISTVISFTFIAGTAVAYLAPTIWGMFIPAFGRVGAIRMTFTLMAVVAFICMLVPVFCIREKDYVDTVPAKESAFGSLAATFKNGEFRKFVASDIFYWIALTMFQTGLPFFVTSLLKLPETMTTLYFVGMTALSLVFYIPVYTGMPETACVKPTDNKNPNNYLATLAVTDQELTPVFDPETEYYDLTVKKKVKTAEITATAVAASSEISGTGTYDLERGENVFTITCTAQTGEVKTYTIHIIRK